jgi:phytoene dehydrogenase-like protein
MKHVVVVGAGLGGLAAGVRLLQRGHRVTLLEKEPRTGGYAIAYKRGGYTFDLALHVVPAGGAGGEFHDLVKSLGIDGQVEFIKLKSGFDVFLGDFHCRLPNDLDELITVLAERFPGESSGLKKFQADLERHVRIYSPVFAYGCSKLSSIPRFFLKLPAFLKHSTLPVKDYLDRFFQDDRLKALLFQPAAFMGIGLKTFPTINFMMMFYLLMRHGMYTVKGGGQRLTDALQEKFMALGGELFLGSEVRRLHCSGGLVRGVETETFNHLACDAVIGAVNLPGLVHSLIGSENFSAGYLRNLESLTPSVSVLALNLGLDCPPSAIGIDNHRAMVFPDPDLDRCFTSQESEMTPLGFSITAAANSDPDWPANSGNTLSIIGGTAREKWLALEEKDYISAKTETTRAILDRAAAYYPQLRDHIVVSDLATPRTMARYTGNPGGAIMGFNCTTGEHRKLIKAARLPLANVIVGSAWTNRLGGFMQSLKSGVIAAEKI